MQIFEIFNKILCNLVTLTSGWSANLYTKLKITSKM